MARNDAIVGAAHEHQSQDKDSRVYSYTAHAVPKPSSEIRCELAAERMSRHKIPTASDKHCTGYGEMGRGGAQSQAVTIVPKRLAHTVTPVKRISAMLYRGD